MKFSRGSWQELTRGCTRQARITSWTVFPMYPMFWTRLTLAWRGGNVPSNTFEELNQHAQRTGRPIQFQVRGGFEHLPPTKGLGAEEPRCRDRAMARGRCQVLSPSIPVHALPERAFPL